MNNFFLAKDGTRYYEGHPFTYNDINYNAGGATKATFDELGFSEVQVAPTPDNRYYIFSGPNDDGSWNSTPRNLDELKKSTIAQDRTTAGQLLSGSDWMIIRREEIGSEPAQKWLDYREEVRTASNDREAAVMAVTTIEELAELALSEWPTDPNAAVRQLEG
jgi:hypothetical protein